MVAPVAGRRLFLVGLAVHEAVMSTKDLQVKSQDSELPLRRAQPARLIRRREAQSAAQVQQDIRRLRDELRADLEDRRRKGRPLDVSGFEYLQNGGHAPAFRLWQHGHIDVPGAAFLQRKAYEFTASLNPGPVIKLVHH